MRLNLMVSIMCVAFFSALAAAVPYEVKIYTNADEFENKYDTTYCLKGNYLSGVEPKYGTIYVVLTKYGFSANIYLEFEYSGFHVEEWEKNLILLIDGKRMTFECDIHRSRYFPERAQLIANTGLMSKIAYAKEITVKLKEWFYSNKSITGYLDKDTIGNIRRFYEEYMLNKRRYQ